MVVGGIFVFTGALAREYDGVSFVHMPWVLVRPLAASIVLSSVLYWMARLATRWGGSGTDGRERSSEPTYVQFLRCYWMTAPMAWLYAYPAERLWDPVTAVQANLLLLAFVSVWRVTLISRVISVLWGGRYVPVLFVVLFFGDAAVLAGTLLLGPAMPMTMGGVRASPRDGAIAGTIFMVMFVTIILFVPLLIAAVVASGRIQSRRDAGVSDRLSARISASLWALAGGGVVALSSLLPFTQPQHYRARTVDACVAAGRVDEAMEEMSRRDASAYPPFWEPSLKIEQSAITPQIDQVVAFLNSREAPEWVTRRWATKVAKELESRMWQSWRRTQTPDTTALEEFVEEHSTMIEPDQLRETLRMVHLRRKNQ